MKPALVVIDLQNGFLNDESRAVVPAILQAIRFFRDRSWPIFATRFRNRAGSGYEKWIGWQRLRTSPEIDLCDEIAELELPVFDKFGYSSFTKEVKEWIGVHAIEELVCCGIATEGCVLKTAVDAFEANLEPIVITDACASHAGRVAHDAGLLVLSRFIGERQLIDVDHLPVRFEE
ncbi:MAG: cysteine hydrolase [Verrucomicrobiota bacterium]